MKIKLKQEQLRKLLIDMHKHGFTSDGCACGEYAYQLDKDLWLFIYRGCKKSSYTPDNKWWNIKGIDFYKFIDIYIIMKMHISKGILIGMRKRIY